MALLASGAAAADQLRLDASHDDLGLGGLAQWGVQLGLEAEFEPVDEESEMRLDRFLLSGQAQGLNFRLGHHQPAPQGLLFDGASGWGLSADASLAPLESDLRVFGVSAESDPGEASFSIPDEAYYTGSLLESQLSLFGRSARLSAGYVSGRETAVNDAGADGLETSMNQGLGYSLGLSKDMLDEQLSLDLKGARSRFGQQQDRSPGHLGDRAYSASLVYAPELAWAAENWQMGVEAEGVGADFHSPGYRDLGGNRSEERLFLRLDPVRDWSLGYSYQFRGQGVDEHWLENHGSKVFAEGALRVSERLKLAPSGKFQRKQYSCRDATRYRSRLSLSASTWLFGDTLAYRNTIELNQTRGTQDPLLMDNERHRHITGELEWQALAPIGHQPGLDMNLSFSADHRESSALESSALDGYRVLLSISSSLAAD